MFVLTAEVFSKMTSGGLAYLAFPQQSPTAIAGAQTQTKPPPHSIQRQSWSVSSFTKSKED